MGAARIHPTAEVHSQAEVGPDTQIWNQSQVREGAHIGSECVLGKNVYIDLGVSIGNRTKIQNNVSVYHGVTIADGVFIGPHVCFCNDKIPRAITPDGQLKRDDDWTVGPITVHYGASIGAGSIIVPDVTIGRFALVGAGSVVTRSVPDHALVFGNPAHVHGYVCQCGSRLIQPVVTPTSVSGYCPTCQQSVTFALTQ
ncbi:MAG TPA: acyltransferase [Ktedonobacterales bacterium]|nr:acyltransferase [Ktedonobacterales bacterium]